MEIVFASKTLIASHPKTGAAVPIVTGTHWPADDEIVRAYPDVFTGDPRFGLHYTDPRVMDEEAAKDAPFEMTTAVPGEKRTVRRAQ